MKTQYELRATKIRLIDDNPDADRNLALNVAEYLREKLGASNGVDEPGIVCDPPKSGRQGDHLTYGTLWLPDYPYLLDEEAEKAKVEEMRRAAENTTAVDAAQREPFFSLSHTDRKGWVRVILLAASEFVFDVRELPKDQETYDEMLADLCRIAPIILRVDAAIAEMYDNAARTQPDRKDVQAIVEFRRTYADRIEDAGGSSLDILEML